MRALLTLAFLTVAAQPQAPAQETKRPADAPAEVDPYTKLAPARVKSAGYVSLGRPLR